jgi:hypothetical protein
MDTPTEPTDDQGDELDRDHDQGDELEQTERVAEPGDSDESSD